jgi:hypothetical protein
MRASLLLCVVLACWGCGRIDSSRTDTGVGGENTGADTARYGPTTEGPASGRPGPLAPDAQTDRAASTATPGSSSTTAPKERPAPDHTAVNERDLAATAKTPLAQGEGSEDLKITADIRNRLVNTENLSTSARNVKIITAGGRVTLRGPVATEQEHDTIVQIAREVAGGGNVDDQIEVAGPDR